MKGKMFVQRGFIGSKPSFQAISNLFFREAAKCYLQIKGAFLAFHAKNRAIR
jgi:hypothetical protein